MNQFLTVQIKIAVLHLSKILGIDCNVINYNIIAIVMQD